MTGSIARRWAKALFQLTVEGGTQDATATELSRLAEVTSDPALAVALANPLLSLEVRRRIGSTLSEQLALGSTTRKFLGLLAERQRLDQLSAIHREFQILLDASHGRIRARLVSAAPLTTEQISAVVDAFGKRSGKQILAEASHDPELLGGLVLEIEGKVYDSSVRTQLERLANAIAGGRHNLS